MTLTFEEKASFAGVAGDAGCKSTVDSGLFASYRPGTQFETKSTVFSAYLQDNARVATAVGLKSLHLTYRVGLCTRSSAIRTNCKNCKSNRCSDNEHKSERCSTDYSCFRPLRSTPPTQSIARPPKNLNDIIKNLSNR